VTDRPRRTAVIATPSQGAMGKITQLGNLAKPLALSVVSRVPGRFSRFDGELGPLSLAQHDEERGN
jgi:hypothetical protein